MRAVSIPPSHRRNVRSPMLVGTASIRDSLSSPPSSGVIGPGYYTGKAIKWFGQKCINGIEDVIVFKRCWQHQHRLKHWSSSKSDAAGKCDNQFFAMLEDLLELSRSALPEKLSHSHCLIVPLVRDCYPSIMKFRALNTVYQAKKLAVNAPSRFNRKEALIWRMNCVFCFIPL